ncbi:MAG: universal stress protein [Gemmatimonadales bacterium]
MYADLARDGAHTALLAAPLLLATDGSPESAGAVAVSALLARERHASVRALTVLDSAAYPFSGGESAAVASAESLADSALERRARDNISRQVATFLGHDAGRTVMFSRGSVVPTISREARNAGAGLIVLGLHPHDLFDRLSGEETTLRVARTAELPLLAVTARLTSLPRRCIVGVDFGPACIRAAREAIELLGDDATIVLAHVRPTVADRDRPRSGPDYDLGVGDALVRLRRSLAAAATVTNETVTLEGEPPAQLLSLAQRTGADLIALGSHRHSFVGRLVLGSVVTSLIRAATVSLLVIPPAAEGTGRQAS